MAELLIDNFVITDMLAMTAYELATGDLNFELTEPQDFTLTQTSETSEVTGRGGSAIMN